MRFSMVELSRALLFVGGVAACVYVVRYDLKAWQVFLVQASAVLAVFLAFYGRLVESAKLLKVGAAMRLAARVAKGKYGYLFGYFFVLAIFLQGSVFVLEGMAGNSELAAYGSALRYAGILSLAIAAVQAVLLPIVQRARSAIRTRSSRRRWRTSGG